MTPLTHWSVRHIKIVAVILSLLCSAWAFQTHLVDLDGTLYLQTADDAVKHGFKSAFHSYNWPFFSILIGIIHQLTGLSLLHAAQGINLFFFALLTQKFLDIEDWLSRKKDESFRRRLLLFSAGLIIAHPNLSSFRHELIRDMGYWALALCALLDALQYLDSRKKNHFLKLNLALGAASLFRIEGILLWFSTSLFLFFHSVKKEHRIPLSMIAMISLLILLWWFSGFESRIQEVLQQAKTLTQTIQHGFSSKSQIIDAQILNPLASHSHEGPLVLFGGLITYGLFEFLKAVGWIFVPFFLYAVNDLKAYKIRLSSLEFQLCLGMILLLFGMALLFLFTQFIVISRWFMLSALILNLATPWILERIREQNTPSRNQWFWTLWGACTALLLFTGIYSFGPQKDYILNAANWLNTKQIPVVWTTDRQLAFYLNFPHANTLFPTAEQEPEENPLGACCKNVINQPPHCFPVTLEEQIASHPETYAAIKISRKSITFRNKLHQKIGSPDVVFQNKHGDAIEIWTPSALKKNHTQSIKELPF